MRWSGWILIIWMSLIAGKTLALEHIIISGGPALRFNEKMKVNTHDRSWKNFTDAAAYKIKQVHQDKNWSKEDKITWLVYRPAYQTRADEEHENLIQIVEQKAKKLDISLIWFDQRKELLDYINKPRGPQDKIARLEYFGHSNKRTWMFDYSNVLDGASMEPGTLHIAHINSIRRDSFTPDAFCKSWGCHSGEEYSLAWYRYTGRRMEGAIGKTDYSQGALPVLSTPGGRWAQ